MTNFLTHTMFIVPESSIEVRMTEYKGRGIFAYSEIPPGKVIGDYVGKIIPPEEEHLYDDTYLMARTDTESIFPDLSRVGIHLINHSCTPNTGMAPWKGHVVFFALRRIFAGEELTINYYIEAPPHGAKHPFDSCCCGSPFCLASQYTTPEKLESLDHYFRSYEPEYFDRMLVPYGAEVCLLDEYPTVIEDTPVHDLFASMNTPSIDPLAIDPLAIDSLAVDSSLQSLPSIRDIRNLLRESGRRIAFPALSLSVLGVRGEYIIAQPGG